MSCRHLQPIRRSRASHATKMPAVCASTGRPYTGILSSDTAVAYDHMRDRTMSLFANLHVATGKLTRQCYRRHRNAESRKCLDHIRPHRSVRPQTHILLENHSNYKARCFSQPLEPPRTGKLTRTPNGQAPK